MKILVLVAHPSSKSFNHAIANEVQVVLRENGHEIIYHDLYAENFNPVLPANEISKDDLDDMEIIKHCGELTDSDGIVIIHPNWWGMPPAILTGWVDRVIRTGVAYKFVDGDSGEGVPVGLLKAQTVLVFNTSDTSEKREEEVFGDPLELIWKNCIFDLCGIKNFRRKMFRILVTSTPEMRKEWLEEAGQITTQYYPRT
jgi:NAD(P)H dehydrogenase (quinone)